MATDETIEECRESFLLYDRRGDRRIETSQIGEVLRALGTNPTEIEVRKIMRNLDSERTTTKRVSFEEFYPLLQAVREREKRDTKGMWFLEFLCLLKYLRAVKLCVSVLEVSKRNDNESKISVQKKYYCLSRFLYERANIQRMLRFFKILLSFFFLCIHKSLKHANLIKEFLLN